MNNNKNYIVFYKNNFKFITVYGKDAIIMNYLFGYKIIDNNKVGFPNTTLDKIKLKIR